MPSRNDLKPVVQEAGLESGPPDIVRTVRKGETLSGIAKEIYGSSSLRILSFLQMSNPGIHNIYLIMDGQILVLPPLNPQRMVFGSDDGRYSVYISATKDPAAAQEVRNQLSRLKMPEITINVVPVWLTGNFKIYRLQAEGFLSKDSAMASLKNILPMKFVESLKEDTQ